MLYLFAALYPECKSLIRHYSLKKDTNHPRFQIFYNEAAGIRLILTGVGNIKAAAAVSSICTEYPVGEEDYLINIGTCVLLSDREAVLPEGIFLCNKITEQTTGRTFYPDILYRHSFKEAEILTGAVPFTTEKDEVAGIEMSVGESRGSEAGYERNPCRLYDMEAAAIYQAGAYFFGPHRMMFLKVVSDSGCTDAVTPEVVERKMEANLDALTAYLEFLRGIEAPVALKAEKEEKREAQVRQLCQDLHCSKTMEATVTQHTCYWSLAGIDYQAVMREFYADGKLPCIDKREGKRCFEEIKRKLL